MLEILFALAAVMAAAAAILLPVSWFLGKMFTTEPPSSAEWLKVFWPADVMPVPNWGFAVAVTTAVSAAVPMPIMTSSALACTIIRVGEVQAMDPQQVIVSRTTVSVLIQ